MSDSDKSTETDNSSYHSDNGENYDGIGDKGLPLHMMTAESIARLDPYR